MEQENKKGKKKGLVILVILLLLLVGVSGTLLLIQQGVFQRKTEISNNISDVEQTLRERLAAEGSETIEITENIEIYGGPLIVNGNKKLVGEGALIAVEGFEDGALLYVSDGAKLQVEEVELNANLMAAYVVYVAKLSEATIGDGVNIGDAAESNVYNEGTLTMTGGRLRKGKVGITNKGTAVIEDGIVALMNRYLVDNLAEGTLEIKGGSFSSSEGYGIYNRGTMTVANAEISANKLMGICNLGKADVKDSLISMNSYHNIINKSRATLTIENTEIVASSQSGIHNEEDAYAVVTSCKFNTNTLGNVHNRGEIEIYKCSFEDVGYSSVISDGKVAATYIEDTTISNTTSTGHGLLSTNGCSVELKDVTFTNVEGRAIHNKGGHVTGKNITVDGTGKVAIGNNAYETGSYGSIKLKNVDVTTPFVAIINDCDGTMEIENGKLISTKQTTVRISSGTLTLEDVAITGAKADGETKFYGVYANGGTLNMTDCSIKDTSSRGIQNYATMMNIDGLTIENTGAAAMGTIAAKEGLQPSTIIANDLTITNAGTNSICNAGATSKIVVTNSVINPAGGNSIKANGGVMTMENTKIYGSQKDECVAVLVDKDGTLYLKKGVYITNEKGRGVTNSGILSMEDTTVENCKTTSHGGAIYNAGQLTVKDSVLYKNVAGANGGAIHATAVSTMKLTNVEMSNNAATGQGGAINLPAGSAEKASGHVQLENVTIQNNKAENYSSGAIYVGRYRQLEVAGKETVISRNTSGTYGGAIGMGDYAVVTMTGGTISDNEALNKNGGGAILLKPYAELTLDGVTISGNTSTANGGAIYLDKNAKLDMTGGSLKDNVADGNGGAIHATVTSTTTLINVKLSGNTATGQGGAINLPSGAENIVDSLMTLENVTIKDNEAKNYSSGAVYVGRYRQLEVTGKKTEISGNVAGTYGGAIGAGEYAVVNITDGTISDNQAKGTDGGGAIFLKPNAELTVEGTTISGNTAYGHGGAVYLSGVTTFNMTGGAISGNEAKASGDTYKNGGAIHVDGTAEMVLNGVELSGNTASGQGGAINLPGTEAETPLVQLIDVVISGNEATNYSSGAVYVGKNRQIKIDGTSTEISGNTAGTYGGAIGAGANASIEVNNATISGNTATTNGGAICLNGTATLTVTGGTIENNKASTAKGNGGGAIFAAVNSILDVNNAEISGNNAYQGGAIYLYCPSTDKSGTGSLEMENVTMKKNTAANSGGAVYVGKYWKVEVDGANTLISDNNVATNGGAFVTGQGSELTLNAGKIEKNKAGHASEGGGAIFLWETAFEMNGGTISENEATKAHGGAIYGGGASTITINAGTISGNTAKQNGGAIYLNNTAALTMKSGTISGNTAKATGGGGVYLDSKSSLTMTGGKLQENKATAGVF